MPDPLAEPSFRGPEVCSLAGISYRQLDYWARTDLIWSSIEQAKGSGTQRRWSREDVAFIRLIRELIDLGISVPRVRKMARPLRLAIGTRDAQPFFVVTSDAAFAASPSGALDVLRRTSSCAVLNLEDVCALDPDLDVAQASSSSTPPSSSAPDGGACAAPGEGLPAERPAPSSPERGAGPLIAASTGL